MSLSRWLGQEPLETTTYEYDDAGRLIRSVTERDPEWSEDDRAWLLAYLAERDEECPGCGQPLDECRDPKTAGKWRIVARTCQACRVLEADRENRAEQGGQRGVYTGAVRHG